MQVVVKPKKWQGRETEGHTNINTKGCYMTKSGGGEDCVNDFTDFLKKLKPANPLSLAFRSWYCTHHSNSFAIDEIKHPCEIIMNAFVLYNDVLCLHNAEPGWCRWSACSDKCFRNVVIIVKNSEKCQATSIHIESSRQSRNWAPIRIWPEIYYFSCGPALCELHAFFPLGLCVKKKCMLAHLPLS